MENTISREEHEEFARRIEDERKRTNHRLTTLEDSVQQIRELTASVERLALSVESMAKSQNRQEARLEELEGRDGEMWRNIKWYLLTLVIGVIAGVIFSQIGL